MPCKNSFSGEPKHGALAHCLIQRGRPALCFHHFCFSGWSAAVGLATGRLVTLPVITWAILIAVIGWTCPLTPLENRFRIAGGMATYELGFIEQYITKRWYPDGLPRKVLAIMGMTVLAANIGIYGAWLLTQ
jgi:hypothetical protein